MEEKKTLNIYERIVGIMSELHYIAKGSKTVNGQYRFVSHDQVTAKVHPLLVKYGVVVIPTVEEMTQEGNKTTVKLNVCFTCAEDPANYSFTTDFYGQGIDSGDKGIGKAISYAYKYALLKTFCLETGDDPDNDANAVYEAPKCLEFDATFHPLVQKEDLPKLEKFLTYSAEVLQKHVEDVKREAVKRPEDFMRKFQIWSPKKKATSS